MKRLIYFSSVVALLAAAFALVPYAVAPARPGDGSPSQRLQVMRKNLKRSAGLRTVLLLGFDKKEKIRRKNAITQIRRLPAFAPSSGNLRAFRAMLSLCGINSTATRNTRLLRSISSKRRLQSSSPVQTLCLQRPQRLGQIRSQRSASRVK